MKWGDGCVAFLAVAGCAGAPEPPATPPQQPTATASAASSAPLSLVSPVSATNGSGALTVPGEIEFEPLPAPPAPDPMPHVEILFPFSGKVVPLGKVDDYSVRVGVENWSGRVQLALDGYRPVLVSGPPAPIPLRALVPADRDLQPGTHRLFAVAIDDHGWVVRPSEPKSLGPFAVVEFRVGTTAPLPDERPFIAYSQPRGTFNGEAAADSVVVDFYLVGVERYAQRRIRVEVRGSSGVWTDVLEQWRPLAIHGLPSGDYDVELTLLDGAGEPIEEVARVGRTITINRDAPLSTPAEEDHR